MGAQVCGGYADALARCAQLLEEHATVDFVDVNMGCPIDLICNKCAAGFPAVLAACMAGTIAKHPASAVTSACHLAHGLLLGSVACMAIARKC